ncbi:MAG TPA: Clp protease N-terminal domain-containing protein [Phycisphaerae bacterium]|nr:Clp protease N-terminal domain-containing protein [Phycisphaerae bacterium]HRW52390.1 Clp protease N-terminal domain-containing protein [Phycisphaerae bacterium]
MYEKLTSKMEQILRVSQRIARDYEQEYVGTEHLLLAILEEGTNFGAEILRNHKVDLPRAKGVIDRLVQASLEDTWVFGRLPGTPHFRNVMAAAIEEARQLESKYVCAEHLLIALARADGSVASAALAELKLTAPMIRTEITRRIESDSEASCSSDEG